MQEDLLRNRIRVLVSCEALRLGMGISYHLARLASTYRLHFARCNRCLPISAEKIARWRAAPNRGGEEESARASEHRFPP